MTITASKVGELRQATGCSMMECKKALVDAHGDIIAAKQLLRERLGDISSNQNPTSEGTLAVASNVIDGSPIYSIVQIGTQTDFAANLAEVREAAGLMAAQNVVEAPINGDNMLAELRSTTKENVRLVLNYTSPKYKPGQSLAFYLHHDRKTAAVIVTEGDSLTPEVRKQLAMHLAAVQPEPIAISPEQFMGDDVSEYLQVAIKKEREYLTKKAEATGKPPEIVGKIVNGGMVKFMTSNALLTQPFIMDPKKSFKDIMGPGKVVKIHKVVVGR